MSGFTEVEKDEDGNEIFWANPDEGIILLKLWDDQFELMFNGETVKQGSFWLCTAYYWNEFAAL